MDAYSVIWTRNPADRWTDALSTTLHKSLMKFIWKITADDVKASVFADQLAGKKQNFVEDFYMTFILSDFIKICSQLQGSR